MKKPFWQTMLFQMFVAMLLGSAVGIFFPAFGALLNPLATAFIKSIRMLIALIIFCTLTVGIAKMGNSKEIGRIALRSVIYFEVVSTIALLLGLTIGNLLQPGAAMHVNPASLDSSLISTYVATAAQSHSPIDFFLNIIPKTAVDALVQNNPLQVLFISVLFGAAFLQMGERTQGIVNGINLLGEAVFIIVSYIMKAAPLAVFGAMSFAIGKFGLAAFASLGKLVGLYYLSCILFSVVIFGAIAQLSGFSLRRFVHYLWDEIVLVFATASSEVGLPRMIEKLEGAGCSASVVGFTVPTGYSFNMDGGAIYMTLAALFIAQATGAHISLFQELELVGIFLLTSKGVVGVPGGSFVTLAGALTMMPDIPVAGMTLILGVDRCMDSMRAAVNMLGNAVAGMAIAKWENERDDVRMREALGGA